MAKAPLRSGIDPPVYLLGQAHACIRDQQGQDVVNKTVLPLLADVEPA